MSVKAFPVDQSTVRAVVQVDSACVATVVFATGRGEATTTKVPSPLVVVTNPLLVRLAIFAIVGVVMVGEVASTTDPDPVVEAAEMAVPFPLKIPVTEVVSVRTGVTLAEKDPANPFAVATVKEVTGAVPLAAAVIKPLAFTVKLPFVKLPTFPFTVARVNAADPGPAADPSPVNAVI